MSDDLKHRGPPDTTKVNVNEAWEVKWWCNKWSVSETQLRTAVRAVGVETKNVAKYLGKNP
jgi:hypothetical protein